MQRSLRGVGLAASAAILVGGSLSAAAQEEGEPRRIGDVLVTPGAGATDPVTAPASVSVVTREQLQERSVRNIADALRTVPGVDTDGVDARSWKTGNQRISLRGLPPEATLVLVDGKRQSPPGEVAPNAFDDALDAFMPPVAAIERIEVIRGPLSTLYGSDAMGGVVNIITRQPGDQWETTVSVDNTWQSDSDFGGYHTIEGYTGGPVIDGLLSAKAYTRLFERSESWVDIPGLDPREDAKDTRSMGQDPAGGNIDTFGGELALTPNESHTFRLGFDMTDQAYNNRWGKMGDTEFGSGYDTEIGFEQRRYALSYEGLYDAGTLSAQVYRNEIDKLGRLIPEPDPTSPLAPRAGEPRALETTVDVADARFEMPLGDHVVTIGGQYLDSEFTDGIPDNTFSTSQTAIFVEDEWFITDRFALTGGLRYEDHDDFGGETAPRLYGVWQATDQWTFKGGYARGFRAPFLDQLADDVIDYGDQGTVPLRGNPDLDPEISDNYELTARWDDQRGTFGEGTLFLIQVDDQIRSPSGAAGTEEEFANVGEADLWGLELDGRYVFNEQWNVEANYTYVDSEVTTVNIDGVAEGDPLYAVPDHRINTRLNWLPQRDLTTFLEMSYTGERWRDPDFHEPYLGGSAQADEPLDDYKDFFVFNLGAKYQVSDNVRLAGTIYNLFDKDFKDFTEYDLEDPSITSDGTAKSNRYNHIYEPRRLYVSLTADF
ncbi:TonB-dependent receptor domain-containing protein [Halorhodospira halophila]|uniref:TonB-dependent receptor domain-containing protein n=1 Tax=Halorhodospira halophila TaxID=1053 RepID=UPI001912358E|nr:TonB-dependent receptor [Halorhodospira halophila]MBK5935439.1 hypothetical protein [Halorhodospira halophila]